MLSKRDLVKRPSMIIIRHSMITQAQGALIHSMLLACWKFARCVLDCAREREREREALY
jgi:hypothetical protein